MHRRGSKLYQGSLTEHIYGIMLQMYEKFNDPMIRARLLDCLGAYTSFNHSNGPELIMPEQASCFAHTQL